MVLFVSGIVIALLSVRSSQAAVERYSSECECRLRTTCSGTQAKSDFFCGDLIFEDDFDTLDLEKWQHDVTLGGNGNGEFQMYRNNRKNSFVQNGVLNIKPRLTADEMDITSAAIDLSNEGCTNSCSKQGRPNQIINPVASASIKTAQSFNFKFGRIEIRARMPQGDWLWPVLSLIPKSNVYGPWPASGQVTVAESRGNANLKQSGQSIGNDLLVSTLHFGPKPELNRYYTALYQKRGNNFVSEFHNYEIEWTPDYIVFRFDGDEYGVVKNNYDFWGRGFFPASVQNPWAEGTKMAPFDQEFYLELRLGVGGTNGYFPDVAVNGGGKPWATNSRTAATDFWNGRDAWTQTWGLDDADESSNLQIDHVRIWAN